MSKQTTEPPIEMVSEEEHRRRLLALGKGLNTPPTDEQKQAEREYMQKHFTKAGNPRKAK